MESGESERLNCAAQLELIKPSTEWTSAYLAMDSERRDLEIEAGYHMNSARDTEEFEQLVRKLQNQEQGVDIPSWFVPQTTFWLVRDGRDIIGEVRLRHHLNPSLESEGGHIGYWIRPSERRKGYGTKILELVLEEARKIGLERVLLTCNPDNIGSRKIIEKNGGVRDTDGVSPDTGKPKLRFWIEL